MSDYYAGSPGLAGVQFEYLQALQDVQSSEREYGQPVVITIRGEEGVNRDSYGSIVGHTATGDVVMRQNAATIEYQPTKYKVEKAGLREECDVIVYVAMKDFTDLWLSFNDLEVKRMSVDIGSIPGEILGDHYEVREKSRAVAYGNGYLYVTLGLRRG